MSRFNTGNPLGSNSPLDRDDNTKNLDEAMNSAALIWFNRFGNARPTMATAVDPTALVQTAVDAKIDAESARDSAFISAQTYGSVSAGLSSGDAQFNVVDGNNIIRYANVSGSANELFRMSTAEYVNLFSQRAQSADERSPNAILSEQYRWAVVDEALAVALGVDRDGVVHAELDRMPGLSALGDYAWAIVDADYVVILGVTWDGDVVTYGVSDGQASTYVEGPEGARDAFAVLSDGVYQLTADGNCISVESGGGQYSALKRDINGVSTETGDLPSEWGIAPFVERIYHIVATGQSLATGTTTIPATTQPPVANRLLTIADGVQLSSQDGTLTTGMVAPFKALTAKSTEPPCIQLASQLQRQRSIPSNAGLLVSQHGRGGTPIAGLSKGSQYYANSITAIAAAKAEADLLELDYSVPFIEWTHGEADSTAAEGAYYSSLLQLQSDYHIDVGTITGQSRLPIVIDQLAAWTYYNTDISFVPLEQLQASLNEPEKFVCAGPKYWCETSDGRHLTTESSMRLGVMTAAAGAAIINGSRWLPLHCTKAVRSGAVVTLDFYVPAGVLTLDTLLVSDPGNYGLRYVDSNGEAAIDAVIISGTSQLTMYLNAAPSGSGAFVGIADIGVSGEWGGPTNGPRSCIRNTLGTPDYSGNPVYHWACHQRIDVIGA